VKIEPANVQDAEEILELQKLAYQSEAALYNDYTIPPLTQTLEEMRADFDGKFFLKASREGKIIGSVRGHLNRGTCFISRLIVHPAHQGRGLGTSLLYAIEKRFPGSGRFELFTGHKSEQNLRLYARLGYCPFKREKISERLQLVYLEKIPSSGVRGQGQGISY
jgi:RimJ/RimL family protein N-acetyltransferase